MRGMIGAHLGLLFAGMATFILMGAGQSLYGPAVPVFARDFGLSLSGASGVISAHWVGCFIGVGAMFAAGHLATPRRLLLVMALGAALMAVGWGWAVTLAGALVFGMGYGCATVLFNPRFLAAFGARGPAMLSLLNATFGIGAIIAPLVFVALHSQPGLSFALVAGLAALVLIGASDDGKVAPEAGAQGGVRPDWAILAFGAVGVGMEACLIGLGPAALLRVGETEAAAAGLLSAFFVAFLAARVMLTFCAHLIAPFSLYMLALAGMALCLLGGAVVAPALFYVPAGAFASMVFPGYFVEAARRMGRDARVAPVVIGAGLIGGISAPLLLAQALDRAGDRAFFWLLGGIAAVVLLLAALHGRMRAMAVSRPPAKA